MYLEPWEAAHLSPTFTVPPLRGGEEIEEVGEGRHLVTCCPPEANLSPLRWVTCVFGGEVVAPYVLVVVSRFLIQKGCGSLRGKHLNIGPLVASR